MSAAIVVDDVWKQYLIGRARYSSLRDVIAGGWRRLCGRPAQSETERTREFHALKGVSFEVEKGTTLGIIGPNGAGKSTLLKLISRVSRPTKGAITTHGRVSALIEVGAGFHPELTGRENVYLNGSILGMKKAEIDGKFDAIVDFSGLEEFIDTPVKYYSSGMYVRLGFSVAVHTEPQILLIDEVLAVGDASFRKKCSEHLRNLKRRGITLVMVSHNLAEIARNCSTAILLMQGRMTTQGSPQTAIAEYGQLILRTASGHSSNTHAQVERYVDCQRRPVRQVSLVTLDGKETGFVKFGDSTTIRCVLNLECVPARAVLGFRLRREDGLEIAGTNTRLQHVTITPSANNEAIVDYNIARLTIAPGHYRVAAELTSFDYKLTYCVLTDACKFEVLPAADEFGAGLVDLDGRFVVRKPQDK